MLEYLVRTKEKKSLTRNVVELSVDLLLPDKIEFKAGQYMQFIIGSQYRAYSIVDVPGQNRSLRFCIQMLKDGVGSDFVRHVRPGHEFKIRGPLGVFTVPEFERDFYFVATGVGVAPFVSIIPDLLSRGYGGQAQLLFGLRSEEDIFYFDTFSRLAAAHHNFKFIPILSQPQSHWPGEVGRVTAYLDAEYQFYSDRLFYLCGGKDMVRDAQTVLLRRGLKQRDMRMEVFV